MSEGDSGEGGGESEGGEAGAGEVEEARHGEGVVADAAMGEEVADVGDEGDVARDPETVGESECDGDAEYGEGRVGDGDPEARGFVFGVDVFGVCECYGDEDQDREVGGEGVVLLVGGEGEEDEDERGEEAEEKGCSLCEGGDEE